MTIQEACICITAIVTIVSLVLSLASFWKNKPKLKIEITDKKWDCFFGYAGVEFKDKLSMHKVCGAKINIINNSPVNITISSVNMIIDKEYLRFIERHYSSWEDVYFYCKDKNNKWVTDGLELCYHEKGLTFPYKIEAYDTITACILFRDYPINRKGKQNGIIQLNTAIGKIKKRVNLVEYNCDYENEDYRDYCKSCRSVGEEPAKPVFFED